MMKKKIRKILTEIVFWLHLPLVVLWFGLFLVPKSIWEGKVSFHFWFIFGIMVVQLIWGVAVFRRFDIICPLTTLMQGLRGFGLKSRKNYGHSYIAELLERLRLRVSYKWVNVILIVTGVVVLVQYIWFRS